MTTRTVLAGAAAASAALALSLSACGNSTANRGSAPTTRAGPEAGGTGRDALLTAGTLATGTATPGQGAGGTITTSGTGTVSGAPDTMTIAINVSTSAPHASAALAHNNAVAAAVQAALQRDGVAVKDVQTTGLSLQQTYPPTPSGYQVDDEVSATLRNLARAGSVIDDAVAAAGDAGRLDGVTFSMADSSPLMAAARAQAVQSSRIEAEQLATAAGEHLGALLSLTDQPEQQLPEFQGAFKGAVAPAAVPVQPGTQQLSVQVTAVWDVGP
jgi:uncharacterized protein YggE